MSTFSLCTGCKNVLRCPQCQSALTYDNSGVYKCSHCTHKTSITVSCNKCGGIEFKNVGMGTQKIEREVADFFPSARIARVDYQTMQNPGAQEKIYHAFSNGSIDILVGTQMLTKGWDLPNVALIGIIDADNMLSFPDFSTNLRAFANIVQVAGRSNRPHSKWRGMVLIQSYDPTQEIFKFILERNFQAFFEKEIAERKALHLPPHGKLIKLVFQDYDKKKVALETERIYTKFEKVSQDNFSSVTEPQECYVPNVRGRFRKQIVLKLKNHQLPDEMRNILLNLPAGWLIDVDPISII
jgi:primosomal protein N' (replication factor Y) (superfamily II helicase)